MIPSSKWVGIGLGVVVAIAAIVYFDGESGQPGQSDTPQPDAKIEFRTVDTSKDRSRAGPANDGTVPKEPIAPWDRSALLAWMDQRIAELDPLVTDPKHRAMAQDLTKRGEAAKAPHYFQSTYDAIALLFDGETPQEHQAGLWIMLQNAKRDDAWAYHNLGNWYANAGIAEPGSEFRFDLWRSAADRDFLPSAVNITAHWIWDAPNTVSDDVVEAYLRYGLDLDAEFGGWIIPEYVLNFYIYKMYRGGIRSDDGYVQKSIERLHKFGEASLAFEFEGRAALNGIGRPVDQSHALDMFLEASALNNDSAMNLVGYLYMGARGVAYNRNLARDYLVACLQRARNPYCAQNLGSLYNTATRNSLVPVVAWAFYQASIDWVGTPTSRLLEDQRNMAARMGPDDMVLAKKMHQDILRGDFSAIPDVGEAQTIDPKALLEARQK